MQLSPREVERLLIFTGAELARRRIREGVPLSHPDCVALASDVAAEAARAGASYEATRDAARGLVRPEQLAPGVRELLDGPLQVEVTFGDGSRLVPLEGIVAE
jgi:urease subunit gamma/beta